MKKITPHLSSFEGLVKVLAPVEHFRKANEALLGVLPNKDIKNVKQRIKQHAVMSIDVLSKSLTAPITSVINFHKHSYQGMHPFEKTILSLTNIARIKSNKPSSEVGVC